MKIYQNNYVRIFIWLNRNNLIVLLKLLNHLIFILLKLVYELLDRIKY